MVCLQIHQPQIMEDIVEFVFFVPQTLENFAEAIQLVPQATSLRGAGCGRPGQPVPQIVGKSLSPVPHITEDTEEVIVAIPVPVFMEDSLEQIVTIPAPQFAGDTVKVDEWPASPSRLISIVAAWCEAAQRRALLGRRLQCHLVATDPSKSCENEFALIFSSFLCL